MSKTHVVEIFKTSPYYQPPSLTIELGDKIKWINRDTTEHTATRSQVPKFDTGLLSKDQESKEIEITQASDARGFSYLCTPHPFMTAKVFVTLPGSSQHRPAHDK